MMERLKFLMVLSVIALLVTWSNCKINDDNGRRKVIGEGPVVKQVIPADTFSIFSHLAIGNVNITTGDSLDTSGPTYLTAPGSILMDLPLLGYFR